MANEELVHRLAQVRGETEGACDKAVGGRSRQFDSRRLSATGRHRNSSASFGEERTGGAAMIYLARASMRNLRFASATALAAFVRLVVAFFPRRGSQPGRRTRWSIDIKDW